MATIKTAQHGNNYCPQAQLDVVESSSTGGATTYSWTLKWVTHGYTVSSSASKAWTVKIDGATVKSGSFAIGGKTTQTIDSGTVTINKGTSSRSVPIYLSFAMTFTWSGTGGSTKTASGSVSLAAKSSYTVSYNANGGSGAPSAQTKWYGTNLTLASGTPSRTGHTFLHWCTNTANTGTWYNPGATYSSNSGVTLYAIWQANTYTVSYNANGGSGAPSAQTKTYGVNLTLSSTRPTRTNYNFLGWSTSASGGVVYNPGSTYSSNSGVTLYAVWQLAYKKPRITNFNAYRSNSSGAASETGTYVKVTANWATDETVSAVYIQWKTQTGSWSNVSVGGSGTSGTINYNMGTNFSIETSYQVRVYVSDSGGTTYSNTASIGTVKFPIDVKAGGTGVAIGKVSEKNAFEVGMPAEFNESVYFKKKSISKQLNTPGWYRVARCSVTGASFIANLYTNYNYTNSSAYVLSFNLPYQQAVIHQISGYENTADTITHVRAVKDSADSNYTYIEVYYNKSVLNGVYFEIINNIEQYVHVVDFASTTSTSTELYSLKLTSGINVGSGQINRGSWNAPTRGLITQVTDNSGGQHSVMVGLKSDAATRLYGIDLYDSDTNPIMNLYAGSKYLSIDSGGTIYANGHIKAGWGLEAADGNLLASAYGNTVRIGNQNASYCHIYNSANIPFYFNRSIQVNGYNLTPQYAASLKSNVTGNSSYIMIGSLQICWGRTSIVPTANTPTSRAITFPSAFNVIPAVTVSAVSAVPGTTVKGVSFSDTTKTGVTIWVDRTNTVETSIDWIAVGQAP